jgi:GNAT superfamily N-acetyltransferase
MEIANQKKVGAALPHLARAAAPPDNASLNHLLRRTPFSHLHIDWQLPGEWLGEPGFVVAQPSERGRSQSEPPEPSRGWWPAAPALDGCLAAIADPLPAAWVRVAAIALEVEPLPLLAQMLAQVKPALQRQGATELGWLAVAEWANDWLPDLGFTPTNEVQTFVKRDTAVPPLPTSPVEMRPVQPDEMATLAAIEEAAFEPLWRHSAKALTLAWRQAISFDAALLDGRLAGFQYSALGEAGAHLCRITVHPDAQRQGVASALLARALNGYRERGLSQVSLNTQADNEPSHRLYEKFGFVATGQRCLVWQMPL